MKALNLHGVNDLRLDDVELPRLLPGEVMLRIRACGICGSDIPRVFTKGTYHFPTIIGHEFAGEIVAAEDGELLGHGAAVFPLLPCKACETCRQQRYAQCVHYDYYGSRRNGAMAEFLAVKKENLVLLPEDGSVSYEAAAMSEPAAVALHAFRKSGISSGDTIVIFGVGPIALMLASFAREAGAGHIILVARSQAKKEFAQKLGFMETIDACETDVQDFVSKQTDGAGANACIEGTGSAVCLEQAVLCAGAFGRIVTLGNPQEDMPLSQQTYWQILRRELSIVGTWNSSFGERENDWLDVMQAMQFHALDVEALITHRFRLDDYEQAFRLMHEKQEMYCKVMFMMGDETDA